MSQNPKTGLREFAAKHPKAFYLVLFVGSFAGSAYYWNATLEQARRGEHTIGLIYAFPALVVLGWLFLLAFLGGEKFRAYTEGLKQRRKSPQYYVFLGALVLPGVIAYLALWHQLNLLGYH